LSRSIESLSQELGRQPTDAELSEDVGCSRSELDETVQSFGCFQPPSIDKPIGTEDGTTLADLLRFEEHELSELEARVILGPVVRQLRDRDRRILFLRFVEDRTQKEIAAELGVSQMQVSRTLARILRDLRSQIGPV
jgi:RNA polymerase sigma-B factor